MQFKCKEQTLYQNSAQLADSDLPENTEKCTDLRETNSAMVSSKVTATNDVTLSGGHSVLLKQNRLREQRIQHQPHQASSKLVQPWPQKLMIFS